MDYWKEKLIDNVNEIIISKSMTNYKTVISNFDTRFKELTEEIVKKEKSMVNIRKYESEAYYEIHSSNKWHSNFYRVCFNWIYSSDRIIT